MHDKIQLLAVSLRGTALMRVCIIEKLCLSRVASVGLVWGACVLVGCLSGRVALASVGLPDGRVYEIVGPANNDETEVYVPFSLNEGIFNYGRGGIFTKLPSEVSMNGEAVVYPGAPTVGGVGNTGAGFGNEYLARRNSGGGWTQVNLQPPGVNSALYQAFSSDLSIGVLQSGEPSDPQVSPLAQDAPSGGYPVLYSRNDIDGGY